ncbi:MAG: peptide chain release factor 1 [Anaerolineae bacterium]|jgi:peptide chain release factor 1|nr:MAG: peptide chain release factor 1 [Anaerolineae bacterium]
MLLDKLRGIEEKYEELNRALLEVGSDYQRAAELNMERSELEPLVEKARQYRQALERREEARSLLDGEDEELRQLAEMEIEELDQQIERLEREIKSMLLPRDQRDTRNVIMEIRAGTGGDEAALFAADLFRMYSRYAEKKGWEIDVLSANEIGIGGYKEIIFMVKGRGAYSRLKYESGVHRVQRVPVTEASGRIHTSTATVAVLAEADEVEVDIPESDLRIDVYKSAGAGGQNVQKNATAIRITHLPTGIVVQCQDERSQLQNKLRAMSILRARLYEIEMEKQRQSIDQARRSQVGTGERAEKIRTYNYPQSRVTDHRINYSSYNLPAVMEGEIDEFIEELALRDEAERLAAIEVET